MKCDGNAAPDHNDMTKNFTSDDASGLVSHVNYTCNDGFYFTVNRNFILFNFTFKIYF